MPTHDIFVPYVGLLLLEAGLNHSSSRWKGHYKETAPVEVTFSSGKRCMPLWPSIHILGLTDGLCTSGFVSTLLAKIHLVAPYFSNAYSQPKTFYQEQQPHNVETVVPWRQSCRIPGHLFKG